MFRFFILSINSRNTQYCGGFKTKRTIEIDQNYLSFEQSSYKVVTSNHSHEAIWCLP